MRGIKRYSRIFMQRAARITSPEAPLPSGHLCRKTRTHSPQQGVAAQHSFSLTSRNAKNTTLRLPGSPCSRNTRGGAEITKGPKLPREREAWTAWQCEPLLGMEQQARDYISICLMARLWSKTRALLAIQSEADTGRMPQCHSSANPEGLTASAKYER